MLGQCWGLPELETMCVLSRSVMPVSATPWTVARQAPLSMGFSRQEYWSGLPCPPPGALPNPGIEPRSPTLQEDSLLSEPPGKQRDCVQFSRSVVSNSLRPHELQHTRPPCPSPTPESTQTHVHRVGDAIQPSHPPSSPSPPAPNPSQNQSLFQ